jgi:ABC-type sugar transport system permease subunit
MTFELALLLVWIIGGFAICFIWYRLFNDKIRSGVKKFAALIFIIFTIFGILMALKEGVSDIF